MPASIAVLTGDLVASSRRSADEVNAAMRSLHAAADSITSWQSPPDATRFTRYRGDGWQVVLAEPKYCLRAAVVLQAHLIALGLESRIFIGIGLWTSLGTASLADASGPAFETSGQGLDAMGNAWRLGIDGTRNGERLRVEDQLIADLLGERMGRWTAAQAEAAAMQLGSPSKIMSLSEIGNMLNISPQAVNDRVRGAGCGTIASVLRRWEGQKDKEGWR